MGHPLDARSDIYSLGVLSYRMLSGSLPFNGPNARDYLVQHIGTPPTPLVEARAGDGRGPGPGGDRDALPGQGPAGAVPDGGGPGPRAGGAAEGVAADGTPPPARHLQRVRGHLRAAAAGRPRSPSTEGPLLELPTGVADAGSASGAGGGHALLDPRRAALADAGDRRRSGRWWPSSPSWRCGAAARRSTRPRRSSTAARRARRWPRSSGWRRAGRRRASSRDSGRPRSTRA